MTIKRDFIIARDEVASIAAEIVDSRIDDSSEGAVVQTLPCPRTHAPSSKSVPLLK